MDLEGYQPSKSRSANSGENGNNTRMLLEPNGDSRTSQGLNSPMDIEVIIKSGSSGRTVGVLSSKDSNNIPQIRDANCMQQAEFIPVEKKSDPRGFLEQLFSVLTDYEYKDFEELLKIFNEWKTNDLKVIQGTTNERFKCFMRRINNSIQFKMDPHLLIAIWYINNNDEQPSPPDSVSTKLMSLCWRTDRGYFQALKHWASVDCDLAKVDGDPLPEYKAMFVYSLVNLRTVIYNSALDSVGGSPSKNEVIGENILMSINPGNMLKQKIFDTGQLMKTIVEDSLDLVKNLSFRLHEILNCIQCDSCIDSKLNDLISFADRMEKWNDDWQKTLQDSRLAIKDLAYLQSSMKKLDLSSQTSANDNSRSRSSRWQDDVLTDIENKLKVKFKEAVDSCLEIKNNFKSIFTRVDLIKFENEVKPHNCCGFECDTCYDHLFNSRFSMLSSYFQKCINIDENSNRFITKVESKIHQFFTDIRLNLENEWSTPDFEEVIVTSIKKLFQAQTIYKFGNNLLNSLMLKKDFEELRGRILHLKKRIDGILTPSTKLKFRDHFEQSPFDDFFENAIHYIGKKLHQKFSQSKLENFFKTLLEEDDSSTSSNKITMLGNVPLLVFFFDVCHFELISKSFALFYRHLYFYWEYDIPGESLESFFAQVKEATRVDDPSGQIIERCFVKPSRGFWEGSWSHYCKVHSSGQ